MRNGITVLFMLIAFSALADNEWFDGVVVLKDDQVLIGQVKHNSQLNIVQVKDDEKMKTFSAYQVAKFSFNDTQLGFIRRFVSVPYEQESKNFSDAFFEVIIQGEIRLLRRAKAYVNGDVANESQEVYNVNGYTINNFQYQHAMSFDYFFQVDGQVVPSDKFKRMLLPDIRDSYNNAVAQFIDDNHLNIHKIYDQVLIIRYYNKIYSSNTYAASGS